MLLQLHFKHDWSNSVQLSQMSFNQMFSAICFFTYSVQFPLITLQERFRGLCADPQKSRPCILNESLDTLAKLVRYVLWVQIETGKCAVFEN